MLGIVLFSPLFSGIFEVSDLLLLLGIYGNDRVALGDELLELPVDVTELLIPFRRRETLLDSLVKTPFPGKRAS